jgi:hypothetical protein
MAGKGVFKRFFLSISSELKFFEQFPNCQNVHYAFEIVAQVHQSQIGTDFLKSLQQCIGVAPPSFDGAEGVLDDLLPAQVGGLVLV